MPTPIIQEPPTVSVIMPAYNAGKLIDRSIRSVLSQTHRELDLIIVDDGSTDDTWEIIKRWERADPRVTPIRQANAGVANARNRAINAARGEFLAPIDSDDLWSPTKLEKQFAVMRQGGTRMGLVYTWWVSIDEEDKIVGRAGRWTAHGDVLDALIFVNFIGNASVPMYRTELVRSLGGYNAKFREVYGQGCEDWDLSLRVARASDTGVVKEYLVGYRKSTLPESMSSDTASMSKSYRLTMNDILKDYRTSNPGVPNWSRSYFYLYLTGISYAAGDMTNVSRWINKALTADRMLYLSPYIMRTAAKARLRRLVSPLSRLIWPDHAAYIMFRRRYRIRLPWIKQLAFSELPNGPVESARAYGWRWWRPYDHILICRWKSLNANPSEGEVIDARRREFSKATT